jgi:hypothetical protein
MTRWIRYYWADYDTWSYIEFSDDGWALRHVELQGPQQRPVTAATLNEVLHVRDHGNIADMRAYERKYGVLADGDVRGWRKSDEVTEITKAEFEQAWAPARRALDGAPNPSPASDAQGCILEA